MILMTPRRASPGHTLCELCQVMLGEMQRSRPIIEQDVVDTINACDELMRTKFNLGTVNELVRDTVKEVLVENFVRLPGLQAMTVPNKG